MARPKKDKNPFEDLPDDFKEAIESASEVEIRNKVSEVAFNEQANLQAKKDDQDLAEAKERALEAGRKYKETSTMNRLKVKYAHSVLDGRGKV